MPSPETAAGPSDEQLGRLVLRVLAGVVALILAGGIASAAVKVNERSDLDGQDAVTEGAVLSAAGGIGPLARAPLDAYISVRSAELEEALGRRAAVISFSSYLPRTEVREVLEPVEVLRLLVAVPGGRPVEAPIDGIAVTVRSQRDEALEEKEALEELLPTVDDPEFERTYRHEIERLTLLLAAPEAAELVYGAVVVGSAEQLRALSRLRVVRLVDPGRTSKAPSAGSAVGIRPEERIQAGEPSTRPLR